MLVSGNAIRFALLLMIALTLSACSASSARPVDSSAEAPAEYVVVGADGESIVFTELPDPIEEDLDDRHVHALYGFYSCNELGTGEAKYLPPFQAPWGDTDVHSHGDGLIHIHEDLDPGHDVTLGDWFDQQLIQVTSSRITVDNDFDPQVDLVAGEQCADGTGTAEIKLVYWPFAFQARSDHPGTGPEIVSSGFADQLFDHDTEVFVIAYVAVDTDIATLPPPPSEFFDNLDAAYHGL